MSSRSSSGTMNRFVRASKFRNVFGEPAKKEKCYDNIRITKSAWDSSFSAANEKFIAVIIDTTGGAFYVIKQDQVGRIDLEHPKILGHKAAVLDVAFNPFNSNIIASCSEDCTVKVWSVPDEGLAGDLETPLLTFNKHGRKVGQVFWHPTAENILFSVSHDLTIRSYDISTGTEISVFSNHPDVMFSASISEDGSKIVTTCKDKKIRIIDTHTGNIDVEFAGHEGAKAAKAILISNERILSVGFSKSNEREIRVWSSTDGAFLNRVAVDTSSGILSIFYDYDLQIAYIYGKGDTSIRYYEIVDEAPYAHYLSTYTSSTPQRGVCWLPKRALNVSACEIARCYKLHAKDFVEPIAFIVPRKSDTYQDDLYPDTQGDEPSMSAQEFTEGKKAAPLKISLANGFEAKTKEFTAPVQQNETMECSSPKSSDKDLEEALDKLKQTVADLEKQLATKDETIRELEAKLLQQDSA